jgi:Mg2+ and Co2+ transporter CorA
MTTMALIDNRIYVNGLRAAAPNNLDETYELLRERDGMAWIGLYRPDATEIHSVAAEFSLHPLAVEDALKGHQRAKLERYGDTLFVVLRTRRIYQLLGEVIDFQRATGPLRGMLEALLRGSEKYKVDVELQRSLRDVLDHVLRTGERADFFRVLLQNALTVHSTLVTQQQNDEMRRLSEASLAQNEEVKRISAWAAILFAPTLIGTIYGMNFDHMPELRWRVGYPLAVAAMVAMGVVLYVIFKRRRWL